MKRLLVSLFAAIAVLGFVFVDGAAASPRSVFALPSFYLADMAVLANMPVLGDIPAAPETDLIAQLKNEILPQIEQILTPEQRDRFENTLTDGMSFRKAFKSLMLTPEQKTQIKTVLQSATVKDMFASLTPEQKKQLFMKKKEMFAPTAEEITEKIEASLKEKNLELPAGIKEKIDAGLKRKDGFMPSAESIAEKIESGLSTIKQQFED